MTRRGACQPGAVPLADWRAIYRGADCRARRRPAAPRSRRGRGRSPRIVAKGEPVYGINTGFGKLASVRIDDGRSRDAAAQHRAVARGRRRRAAAGAGRAADDGAEAREPRPGRVGRALADARSCSRRCSRAASSPVVPGQGSVGASGDLAPLAHMAAAMIGVGEFDRRRRAHAGRRGAGARRAGAARARRQGRAGAAQRHAGLDRAARWPACSRPSACSRRRSSPARSRPTPRGLRRAVRSAHPRAARPSRPDRGRRGAARADGGQRHPRLASRRRRPRAGPLLPALPAAGDGRRASTCCARPRATLATEANGVSDNPLVFAETGEVALRRQLPRRAGRLRRRHDRAGALRDRLARRAAHRHAGRSGAVAACRPSSRRGRG